MSCKKCGSSRIVNINGKTSDMFGMTFAGTQVDGYVPDKLFFGKDGYGDYFNLDFCADCGMIQAKFPISDNKLLAEMKNM